MDNKKIDAKEEPKTPPKKKDWKGLEKIKSMDFMKVSQESYISYDAVQAIAEKDFCYFPNAMKARKFIGMLEKQYDVNLQDWLVGYAEAMGAEHIEDCGNEKVLEHYPIDNDLNPKKATAFGGVFFFVLISAGIIYYLMSSDSQNQSNTYSSEILDINQATAQNLEKSKEVLANLQKRKNQQASQNALTVVPLGANRHKKSVSAEDKESIYNELNPDTSTIDILDRDIQIDYNQSILDIQGGSLSITTNLGRVWIGIVDADTYDKKSDIVEGEKTYEVFDNTIIITGHGHVTLRSGEDKFVIALGKKQYFYYKNNSFVRLSREEYLYLNKGIEW